MDKPLTPQSPDLHALQDAVFDAFAAYWRERESDQAEQLWADYRALEGQLDEVLSRTTFDSLRAPGIRLVTD